MEAFSQLFQALDQTTSTNKKVSYMVDYFNEACEDDAAWAVFFLSGRRLKRLVGAKYLRQWLVATSELPEWLIEETYAQVGDLAETIALLVAQTGDSGLNVGLANWVQEYLLPLRELSEEEKQHTVTHWWRLQSYQQCFINNKLMTGAFRVGVSQLLVARAIAHYARIPRALVLHRLMGDWQPSKKYWLALTDPDGDQEAPSQPYPFFLASALEKQPESLGPIDQWQAEWKWDGIRAQLIRRQSQTYLWSRGEELIGPQFPEIIDAANHLPDGTVLDGEILPWKKNGVLPFSQLQRRLGRKNVGKKLLQEVPCIFLTYDGMELNEEDIRQKPLSTRRDLTEKLLSTINHSSLQLSPLLTTESWQELALIRTESREKFVEGLMLKKKDSTYYTGRKRGYWWKWKVEPYTIDAVMLYAQAGHGKRANLYTDYTFGVWQDDKLVPIAKAYSGLSNNEISELDRWIRRNTHEKFGPVRSVAMEQVFELAFEGINKSTRHKSGVAVRFPRISRWRKDLKPKDADTLADVQRLIIHDPV